jgi:hypothetical protein
MNSYSSLNNRLNQSAIDANPYNQVAYDLIKIEDDSLVPPTAPPSSSHQTTINTAMNELYTPIRVETNQLQASNVNNVSDSQQAHHDCFFNENGVTYRHIMIPYSYQNAPSHFIQPIILYNNSNQRDAELKRKFPSCYISFHCTFLIILSIGQILMQAYIYHFGPGVWSGAFQILIALFTFFSRTYFS